MKTTLLCCLLALGCGCNVITFEFTRPDGTRVKVAAARAVWSTDSYDASLTTNGASLKAVKSGVNTDAIAAATEGAVRGALSAKGGAP